MSYQTVPGTIPHRVATYLHSKPQGFEISTLDLCNVLDVDVDNFVHVMDVARYHRVVQARMKSGQGNKLFWSAGPHQPGADELAECAKRRVVSAGGLHLEEYTDGTVTVRKRSQSMALDKDESRALVSFCLSVGRSPA